MLRKIWDRWKAFGRFIGNLLARVFLTIFYATVFVPFGLGVSLFSDQLSAKTRPARLWRTRETKFDDLDLARRQF